MQKSKNEGSKRLTPKFPEAPEARRHLAWLDLWGAPEYLRLSCSGDTVYHDIVILYSTLSKTWDITKENYRHWVDTQPRSRSELGVSRRLTHFSRELTARANPDLQKKQDQLIGSKGQEITEGWRKQRHLTTQVTELKDPNYCLGLLSMGFKRQRTGY